MVDSAVLEQAHPLFASRNEQGLEPEFAAQGLRPVEKVFLAPPAADNLAQLGFVRRHHGRAPIGRKVVPLGIDQDGLSSGAGSTDHLGDVRQTALAVVREQNHVAGVEHPGVIGQLFAQHLAARLRLEIDAQELLLPPDHAQLDRGGERRVAVQAGMDALLRQKALQPLACLVITHDGEQRSARPQCRGIAGHVGRPAGPLLDALHLDNRHRCLGRDAAHFAEPVAVEHGIADHQDSRPGQSFRPHDKSPFTGFGCCWRASRSPLPSFHSFAPASGRTRVYTRLPTG